MTLRARSLRHEGNDMNHQTTESIERLRRQNSHRIPDAAAVDRLREIRQKVFELAIEIDELLPASREKSLVLTKLEEARMWACNAITMDGEIREELTIPE